MKNWNRKKRTKGYHKCSVNVNIDRMQWSHRNLIIHKWCADSLIDTVLKRLYILIFCLDIEPSFIFSILILIFIVIITIRHIFSISSETSCRSFLCLPSFVFRKRFYFFARFLICCYALKEQKFMVIIVHKRLIYKSIYHLVGWLVG